MADSFRNQLKYFVPHLQSVLSGVEPRLFSSASVLVALRATGENFCIDSHRPAPSAGALSLCVLRVQQTACSPSLVRSHSLLLCQDRSKAPTSCESAINQSPHRLRVRSLVFGIAGFECTPEAHACLHTDSGGLMTPTTSSKHLRGFPVGTESERHIVGRCASRALR